MPKEEVEITMEEFVKFRDNVKQINGVLRITIPFKEAQFLGIKEGDAVRVWVRHLGEGQE